MTMAGDKDDKHHLSEADENLEKALQEPKLNISERARAHKNTHNLQWLLLTQAGEIPLSCLGLSPQICSFPSLKAPCLPSKAQAGEHGARPVPN